MISIEVVTNLHVILINKYGGIHGVRDYNALEHAVTCNKTNNGCSFQRSLFAAGARQTLCRMEKCYFA